MTHLFLFDVSGSMRQELALADNRGFVREGLLGNPAVVLPADRAIVRRFSVQSGPPTYVAADPMRLWPRGALEEFGSTEAIRSFASSMTAGLSATSLDTDIAQALALALADREVLAPGATTAIWILTDNWQDVKGSSAGITGFYDFLGQSEMVRDVILLPLVRNTDGVEGNMVLYCVLVDDQDDPAAVGDFGSRVMNIAHSAASWGYTPGTLVPISCRRSSLRAPRISDKRPPSFEGDGLCDGTLEKRGSSLVFKDLDLGIPLTGRMTFTFESVMSEWRIRNAAVTPMRFQFSSSSGSELVIPAMAAAQVLPPVIEEMRPGEALEVRHQVLFPSDGLLVPELERRSLRHWFPGATAVLHGRARLSILLDVRNDLLIDNETLNRLTQRIHLIEEIRRIMSPGAEGAEQVPLIRDYPVEYHVAIGGWTSRIGLIVLLLLVLTAAVLSWKLAQAVTVRYAVDDGDERRVQVSVLRSGTVAVEETRFGEVRRRLSGGLTFHPVGSSYDLRQSDPRALTGGPLEVVLQLGDDSHRVRLSVEH